tara:strand:+ start:237 stop:716 length:480 start_codon:yes stop_codon:yes gene_type:complete
MTIQKKIISIAVAGSVLFGMAGAAMAAQAVVTSNVNVRSGPSTSYSQVDVLRRNQVVEVTGCRGGWCYVEKRGPDGWVSANYLQGARGQSTVRPGVNFSFSFGTPPAPPRVVRPTPDRGGWHDRDDRGGWDRHDRGGWDRDGRGDWDRRDRDGWDGWNR